MARPKSDFPAAQAIRALADNAGRLAVKVTPGARVEAIELGQLALIIKTRAKPTDGQANEAVLKLLARALGVGVSSLTLLQGAASRNKLVQI